MGNDKRCPDCGQHKPLEDFGKWSRAKDGLTVYCKFCTRARVRRSAARRKLAKAAYDKKYRENNADKIKARLRKWAKANLARIIKLAQERRNANRSVYRVRRAAYLRKYYAASPSRRLDQSVSVQLRKSLNGSKGGRSWEKLVGYTLHDLLIHLEGQFKPGMTWDNYGLVWVIDHKVPKAWFVYNSTDDPGFKDCWGLSNLQPLWKSENDSKGARYAHFA